MVKNIVFDMGNVLIKFDSKRLVKSLTDNKADQQLLYEEVFGSLDWIMLDKGELSEDELVEACGQRLPSYLKPKIKHMLEMWHENPEHIPGMYYLVKQLKDKGYPVYVLSNTKASYHSFKKNIPATQFMNGEMISAEERCLKPFEEIYIKFTDKFKLRPEECYFIDDTPTNILAAKALGWEGYVFHGSVKKLREDLKQYNILNEKVSAVIFDLDGVLLSTDKQHYTAWKKLAEHLNIPFGHEDYEEFRGVSRYACMQIMERIGNKQWSEPERRRLGDIKNNWYKEELENLDSSALLPGAVKLIDSLKAQGVLVAVGSSSQNAGTILKKLNLYDKFDCVVDGTQILHSKPHPEVFAKAGEILQVPSGNCLVIEDATAGIDAALAAGMLAMGIGAAENYCKNDYSINTLDDFPMDLVEK